MNKTDWQAMKFQNLDTVYVGVYRKYMDEYFREFLGDDFAFAEKQDEQSSEEIKDELKWEAMHIECFCKWLEEKRKVLPKEAKKCKK